MIKLNPEFYPYSFADLNIRFEKWFDNWNPLENHTPLNHHFDYGNGHIGGLKSIKQVLKGLPANDFKGIYVFIKDNIPFYVGISGGVIKRIIQHLKGNNHFSSSLCYKLGANYHFELLNIKHTGRRKDLDFDKWGKLAKQELLKCNVAIMAVEEDLELYLFEVFVSMKLGTLFYNLFKTH